MYTLGGKISEKGQAMRTLEGLKSIIKDLIDDQKKLSKDYTDRIEQLEAEVASWKNSYKRAVRDAADLMRKLAEERDEAEAKLNADPLVS